MRKVAMGTVVIHTAVIRITMMRRTAKLVMCTARNASMGTELFLVMPQAGGL